MFSIINFGFNFFNNRRTDKYPLQSEIDFSNPICVARFGSTEIKAILFPFFPFLFKRILKKRIFSNMEILSGFFPVTDNSINHFSKLMIAEMQEVDILGSWRVEELFLAKFLKKSVRVPLQTLEPYFQENPWSILLEDRKVLVIHPFSETIEIQYHAKRELLFKDKRVLPKFKSLQTIKAVQTIAGNTSDFTCWFDALGHMKSQIDSLDFDIAIIGCGAYGFPLATYIKRQGKCAIHLGGATQILFGVKGKRWLENKKFKHIINEHFVFPMESEKVNGAHQVEGACYW